MRESSPMDIVVFGPLRSGTTMIADLLTVKGRSLVLSEPDLHVPWHERTVQRLHRIYRDVGLAVPATPPERVPETRAYVDWFADNVLPQLEQLDLWGIKMVDFYQWRKLYERFPPRRTVLVTRDLRAVALSSLDLIGRSWVAFQGGTRLRDEAWVMAQLAYDMHELAAMAKLPHLHLRYRDFVSDEACRERLRRFAGLERFGEDRFNLDAEDDRRAAWEKEKHGGEVSENSRDRYLEEPDGPMKAMAERLWRCLPAFAERFGHDLPDNPVADHPFAACPEDGSNPVDRVRDVETWDGVGPGHLEPAFARRIARIHAGNSIARPARVLDLFCGAPALRFLLKKGSSYRGADVARRYDDCETIDLGTMTLPGRRDADVVTVLGALEYLDDLKGFLGALAAYGVPILASYHASDDTGGTDRAALGWRNHLGRAELTEAFAAAGLETQTVWAFDGRQSLIKATPASR